MPSAGRASANSYCFNIAIDGTGEAKLKSTDIPDRQVFAIKHPANLLQGEAIISVSTFESGEASFVITVLNSTKETLIGFIQSFNHTLKRLRAYFSIFWKGYLQFRKLLHLVKLGYRTFVLLVDCNTLIKSSIIEMPAKVKPMFSLLNGVWIRLDTIFEGFLHLPSPIFSIIYFRKGVKEVGWSN